MEVDDLFTDLADGKKLLKLLEIISGERLAKPNNGRMRVHKIENVNKSLAFLHTKVIHIPESMACPLSLSLYFSIPFSLDVAYSRKLFENELHGPVRLHAFSARTTLCVRRGVNKGLEKASKSNAQIN